MSEVPSDLTPYFQLRDTRSMQLSAAAFVAYEYFLQIDNEIELFWKRRWNVGKVFFLWARYWSLCYLIVNAAYFVNPNVNDEVSEKFFSYQNPGALITFISIQAIMALRLYAMYGKNKIVLGIIILVICGEFATLILLLGAPPDGLIVSSEPYPGVHICSDADPEDGRWITYVSTAVLVTESVFLILAVGRVVYAKMYAATGRILPWFVGQSIWYFAVIFLVHFTNQIIWIPNKIATNEIFTAWCMCLPTVLAQRLLISVRLELDRDVLSAGSNSGSGYTGGASNQPSSNLSVSQAGGMAFTKRSVISEETTFEMDERSGNGRNFEYSKEAGTRV